MSDKVKKGFAYARLSPSVGFSQQRSSAWKRCTIITAIVTTAVVVALLVTTIALVVSLSGRRGKDNPSPSPSPSPTPTPSPTPSQDNCLLSLTGRFDCLPGIAEPSNVSCLEQGCCWDDSEAPFCFHSSGSGYTVENEFRYTEVGVRGCLIGKQSSSAFGESLKRLCVNVTFETDDRLHIKVGYYIKTDDVLQY